MKGIWQRLIMSALLIAALVVIWRLLGMS